MWKPLFFAVSLCAALSLNAPSAMAHGGGGGGHCGGGGGHCGGGGGHFGGGGHISTGHTISSCGTHAGNLSGHAFSIFGPRTSNHLTSAKHVTGLRTLEQKGDYMRLQEVVQSGAPSSYCSSIVRSEAHAGLLGHIHRFFADRPCDLQNIHTEIMPRVLTEIACEPMPVASITHQIFSKENLALNELAAKTLYLRANALKYRYLDQTNRNLLANQTCDSYFSININNQSYPANDLDLVLENENTNNIATEIVATEMPQTFSGLSYMLPHPGGILSIYFSYESTINNFLLLHKGSFLAVAMNQSL
jgi:hypothetical protein